MKAVRGKEKPQKLIYAVNLCYKTEPRSTNSALASGTGTDFLRLYKANIQVTDVRWAEKPRLTNKALTSMWVAFPSGSFKT